MRGRKPKPLERQIAEGDPRMRGKRKLQERLEAQVKARGGLPRCPTHLRGRARACWNLWKHELELMGLDCRPDAMMLEGACVNYARAVQADRQVARLGITVEEPIVNDEGEEIGVKIRKNPAVEVSNRSWLIARAFCSEFGLSPVSRTRLTIDGRDSAEDQDLEAGLHGPRLSRVGN